MSRPAKQKPNADRDPAEIVHLHVRKGQTVIYDGKAYGDRATLQAPRFSAQRLLDAGVVDEVDSREVPDVAA